MIIIKTDSEIELMRKAGHLNYLTREYLKTLVKPGVTTKEIESIYNAMKNFIQNGFDLKAEFDYQKFNEEIIQSLEKIF